MKAVVVYESYWGNTAAVAQAIAEGIGPGTAALNTAEATAEALIGADLLVVGAPVLGFSLPTEGMRKGLVREKTPPLPGTLSRPSVRSWLETLPSGKGRSAAFETGISWSPGGATKLITRALERAGFPALAQKQRFLVADRYGPLKAGELDRAREWGQELAADFARLD